MEKLTDAEIVKALECCSFGSEFKCQECPADDCSLSCGNKLAKQALDLIERKDAEIERLQKIIVGFMDEVGTWSNKYEVDISTILKLPLLAKEDFNIRNKIKSEAYREFAKLVNRRLNSNTPRGAYLYNIMKNVEKELTEKNDEE